MTRGGPKRWFSARGALLLIACLLGLAAYLLFASPASAGQYAVIQCSATHNPIADDAVFSTNNGNGFHGLDRNCALGDWADFDQQGQTGVIPWRYGQSGFQWGMLTWQAPSTSMIFYASAAFAGDTGGGDYAPELFLHNGNWTNKSVISGATNFFADRGASGWHDTLSAQLSCARPACSNMSTTGKAWIRNVRLFLQDTSTPSITSTSGSVYGGGWKRGVLTSSATSWDHGGGVARMRLLVNGHQVASESYPCNEATTMGAGWSKRMSPCGQGSKSASSGNLNTAAGPWREGANTVTWAAEDFAGYSNTSPNQGSRSATVNVDNLAPQAVDDLALSGGEGWRSTNDFDLSWQNPSQPESTAPLGAIRYRITSSHGYDSGIQRVGSAVTELQGLSVPAPGDYVVEVWAEDAAGNHDASTARIAHLRFDDTVPPVAEANYNGWIRRADFGNGGFRVEWNEPSASHLGPSGLAGYAVVISDDPNTDPCLADGEPSCRGAEINQPPTTDSLILEDYPSGEHHYVHVVPVTGAGLKADQVGHTKMPVDREDPAGTISGVPEGWVNHTVTVEIKASDALSGMDPDPTVVGVDPQPQTVVRVNGEAPIVAPERDVVSTTINTEGEHTLAYWARDLAGNENNGQMDNGVQNNPPSTATVRIDKTGPQVHFADQEVEDPAMLRAPVADRLSGVASGEIKMRPTGGGEWRRLDTSLVDGELRARVPDSLPRDRWVVRAQGTDKAGNTTATTLRADGSEVVITTPVRIPTHLGAGLGKRQAQAQRLRYGKTSYVAGILRSETGAPIPDQDLVVTESYGPGSKRGQEVHAVTTDADGRYHVALRRGPSRKVSVTYAGTRRYLGSEVNGLSSRVRSKVLAFRAPKAVREDGAIRFKGRIGVRGAKLGKLGKRVELEYRKGKGQWKTIDTGRARKRGRFGIRYALRSNYTQPVEVPFRATIPKERGFPYAGRARSRVRTVVIKPR